MLRISKLTDYAMLIMSQMAKAPDAILSAKELAYALHLSAATVSKILKILADADLVKSIRGALGGYQLSRPSDAISVADIIAAMEGNVALTECCQKINQCNINSICTMKDNWRKINELVSTYLGTVTITDMLKPLSTQRFWDDK